jgi:hypothetical protein
MPHKKRPESISGVFCEVDMRTRILGLSEKTRDRNLAASSDDSGGVSHYSSQPQGAGGGDTSFVRSNTTDTRRSVPIRLRL